MTPNRIAVTGARGFLGSHLVQRATNAGASVLAIGREAGSGIVSSSSSPVPRRRLSEGVTSRLGRKLPPIHVPLVFARASTCIDLARYRGRAFGALGTREPPLNHEKLDVMTLPIEFDTTKLRKIGFTPRIGYEEGLARTVSNVERT